MIFYTTMQGFIMPFIEEHKPITYYEEHGSGDAIFLLHGFTSEHSTWAGVAEILSKTHKIITPDLRGHGKSGKLKREYSIGDYTRDLKALIDHLGVEDPVVCGHSASCAIVMDYAYKHPTNGILLYSPLYEFGASFRERAAKTLVTNLRKPFPLLNVKNFRRLAGIFSSETKKGKSYRIHGSYDMDTNEFLKALRAMDNFEPKRDYRARVGVLLSKKEPSFIYPQSERLKDIYSDVKYFVLDGGHHMQRESPEKFCGALLDFIESAPEKNYKSISE